MPSNCNRNNSFQFINMMFWIFVHIPLICSRLWKPNRYRSLGATEKFRHICAGCKQSSIPQRLNKSTVQQAVNNTKPGLNYRRHRQVRFKNVIHSISRKHYIMLVKKNNICIFFNQPSYNTKLHFFAWNLKRKMGINPKTAAGN